LERSTGLQRSQAFAAGAGSHLKQADASLQPLAGTARRLCLGRKRLFRQLAIPPCAPMLGAQEKSTWRCRQVLVLPTEFGRREWTRTIDPHHVKVVL
jgi:hypothetical protein